MNERRRSARRHRMHCKRRAGRRRLSRQPAQHADGHRAPQQRRNDIRQRTGKRFMGGSSWESEVAAAP